MSIPRKRYRLDTHRVSTDKRALVDIMVELEPGLTKQEARRAYDRVTRAINGWLRAHARGLPTGTHARLLLSDCYSVNLCWMKGKTGVIPPFLAVWLVLSQQPRRIVRKASAQAYHAWKAQGKP